MRSADTRNDLPIGVRALLRLPQAVIFCGGQRVQLRKQTRRKNPGIPEGTFGKSVVRFGDVHFTLADHSRHSDSIRIGFRSNADVARRQDGIRRKVHHSV